MEGLARQGRVCDGRGMKTIILVTGGFGRITDPCTRYVSNLIGEARRSGIPFAVDKGRNRVTIGDVRYYVVTEADRMRGLKADEMRIFESDTRKDIDDLTHVARMSVLEEDGIIVFD
jgi:hypothetical protein